MVTGREAPPADAKEQTALVNWPQDAPRWEPYLAWQSEDCESEAIATLKELARESFERRHGYYPAYVFHVNQVVYAGPVRKETR